MEDAASASTSPGAEAAKTPPPHILTAVVDVVLEGRRLGASGTSCMVACGEYGMGASIPSQAIKLIVSSSNIAALSYTWKDEESGAFIASCKIPVSVLEPTHGQFLERWLPLSSDSRKFLSSLQETTSGAVGRVHVVLQYFNGTDVRSHAASVTVRVEQEFRRRSNEVMQRARTKREDRIQNAAEGFSGEAQSSGSPASSHSPPKKASTANRADERRAATEESTSAPPGRRSLGVSKRRSTGGSSTGDAESQKAHASERRTGRLSSSRLTSPPRSGPMHSPTPSNSATATSDDSRDHGSRAGDGFTGSYASSVQYYKEQLQSQKHVEDRLAPELSQGSGKSGSVRGGRRSLGGSASSKALGSRQEAWDHVESGPGQRASGVDRPQRRSLSPPNPLSSAPLNGNTAGLPDATAANRDKRSLQIEIEEAAWRKSEPYRNIIVVMEQKLRVLEDLEKERLRLTQQLEEGDAVREELRSDLISHTEKYERQLEELRRLHGSLLAENQNLHAQLQEATNNIYEKHEQQEQLVRMVSGQKASILLLEGKIKVHQTLENQVANAKLDENEHYEARLQMQKEYTAAIQQFGSELDNLRKELSRGEGEKQELRRSLDEVRAQLDSRTFENERLQHAALDPALLENERRQRQNDRADIEALRAELAASSSRREQLEAEVDRLQAQSQQVMQQERNQHGQLVEELSSFKRRHCDLLAQQAQCSNMVAQLTLEKNQQQSEVISLTAKLMALEEVEGENELLRGRCTRADAARERLEKELTEQQDRFQQELQVAVGAQNKLRAESEAMRKEHAEAMRLLRQKTEESRQWEHKHVELASTVLGLESRDIAFKDAQSQLEKTRELCEHLEAVREEQRAELAQLQDRFRTELQRWEGERRKLLADLESKDREAQKMMLRIGELGTGYIPVKNDAVDKVLAEKVREEPPPVPFFRTQAGVYLFGTRTCNASVQHGCVVFRVGGGFVPYERFVSTYGPEEAEKLRQLAASDDAPGTSDGSKQQPLLTHDGAKPATPACGQSALVE